MNNIFRLPDSLPHREIFETLFENSNLRIERIISTGQITPPDYWYDQAWDEWVILLQGEAQLSYEDGIQISLKAGDYLFLKAHQKHRVDFTRSEPPCLWLAIHFSVQ